TIGSDGVGADRAQERIVVGLLAAKIRAAARAAAESPADEAQISLDEHAVAEQQVEKRRIAERFHQELQRVVEAVERIDASLDEEGVGEARQGDDRSESDPKRGQIKRERCGGRDRDERLGGVPWGERENVRAA